MRAVLLITLLSLLSSLPRSVDCNVATTPPHILFILLDDVGSADLGFAAKLHGLPSPAIPTPNIDYIASSGITLTKYYTHMICGPSRASLLTGRSAYSLGNPFPRLGNHGGLHPVFGTLADELTLRNYSTAAVGKWGIDFPTDYLTPNAPKKSNVQVPRESPGLLFGPTSRGFESFYGLYGSAHNHRSKEVIYKNAVDLHSHNRTSMSFVDFPSLSSQPDVYSTDLFTSEAVRIIEETWSHSRPSFLYLAYTAPHDPLQSPPPSSNSSSKCGAILNWRRRVYCEMLSSVDSSVGVLLSTLSKNKHLSNTLVVLTSDNGALPAGGGINAPYRGVKGTPYEGGVHVPAVLSWGLAGGMAAAGTTFGEIFHVSDWAPTLLGIVDERRGESNHSVELLNGGGLTPIDGKDHSLRFFAPDRSDPVRSELLLEYNVVLGHTAFIAGDYKILLGNLGRSSFFGEPRGRWVDSASRRFYVFEEVLCNCIDWGLGPNWFPFANALRLYFDYLLHWMSGDPHADDILKNIEGKKLGDVMEVTESNLPRADWDLFDKGFVERVQLYNLKEDPYETVNLAGENRELVEDMIKRAANIARGGPVKPVEGQHLSLVIQFKGFADFMVNILKAGMVGLLLFVLVLGSWCARKRERRVEGGRVGVKKKKE